MSRDVLEGLFPNLVGTSWQKKSERDTCYNCIAWAACENHRRWWPSLYPGPDGDLDFWPEGVPRDETVDCFIRAFQTIGYRPCPTGNFQFGYEKVAIYADSEMTPTHMARQSFWGGWLSKLGDYEDILHRRLRDLEGDTSPHSYEYGIVVQFLKRSWWQTFKHWRGRHKLTALRSSRG